MTLDLVPPAARGASLPVHKIRVLWDLKTPMRDGIRLSTDVFMPRDASGPFPTLLLRTPYETLHEPHIDWAAWWAKRGYAVAIQDCRGRFESEGEFRPYFDDGRDGHDTLGWLAEQPWCNGKIGTSGRSYGGLFQWQLAPYRSPHLTAMAPQVIMGDYFGECHRTGGAVQWTLTGFANVIFNTSVSLMQRGATHIFGNSDYYRHLPLMTLDEQTIGRESRWWREWFEHAYDDEFWHAINTYDRLHDIDVPIRQQAAWYDPYAAAGFKLWNGMREQGLSAHTRQHQQIYVIPWTHHLPEGSKLGDLDFGPSAAVDLKEDDLRWFDHWLKGIDTGIADEPPIKLFVMGENVWRFEHEWPLARTSFTRYYLHSGGHANSLYGDGSLSPEPPAGEPPDRYDYDPDNPVPTLGGNNSTWTWMKFAQEPVYPGPVDQRPIERRDDVLVYSTAALDADLEVTGPLELVLYAASSARDTDFTAKLVDVYPDGRAIHLAEGIVRARHRVSLASMELLTPGEIEEYRIELAPTSNLFRRGHRVRVEISSSNFPRFDRNLNTGDDLFWGTRMQIAHQTVVHSTAYPSHIVLPVIPR